jgi:hypothetical protein
MSRKRRIAYLIMIALIIKHLFADSYGPLDRFLEIGVLLLIGYEVVVGIRHRRTENRRRSLLNSMVFELSRRMSEGQRLQSTVPHQIDQAAFRPWVETVGAWAQETGAFLEGHSMRAYSAFSTVAAVGDVRSVASSAEGSVVLLGPALQAYQGLVIRMNNLRGIIENAEAYF